MVEGLEDFVIREAPARFQSQLEFSADVTVMTSVLDLKIKPSRAWLSATVKGGIDDEQLAIRYSRHIHVCWSLFDRLQSASSTRSIQCMMQHLYSIAPPLPVTFVTKTCK